MGEIKSVKVDNWGVFFLQKLQNFFNKTDYCDLTLQFNDNSQLKVHRLVLSACTDYFNVLEQTCEVVDDALIMPNELQADVVVPIVNFMYTGTLEFELKMYGKLLRTAKEMNMTVLLKLLEAHRRTMESGNRWQRGCDSSSPKNARKRGQMVQSQTAANTPTRTMGNVSQQQQQQSQVRRATAAAAGTVAGGNAQHRVVQTKVMSTNIGSQEQYRQQIGSTTLTKTSDNVKLQQVSAAYESALQMKHESDDYEPQSGSVNQSTSPFEQLRKGYNNNKRPSTAALTTPASKRPNIEDVKEFAEQQRMRKQIAAEYGDDPEYEGGLDDDIHNDDDDDDPTVASSSSHLATGTAAGGKQSSSQTATSIIIKQDANDKPTIVVKDSPNSKMNHAKIISEVLRQYPHLVKSNKNIKLKIMQNVGGQTQKIILKKDTATADIDSQSVNTHQASMMKAGAQQSSMRSVEKSQSQHQQQPHQERVVSQKTTAVAASATSTTTATAAATTTTPGGGHSTTGQKRCIDSRTMHALIALGAENTTGPWLCLKCGINGRPISIPSYRGFRRHLINTHKETIDAALCEHCGWRSMNNRELHYHMQLEHKVKTSLYTFSECAVCGDVFVDANTLNQHTMEFHPEESQQQCIYCNKVFAKDIQLYTHLKSFHKKQAAEDGIIDYSDDELGSQEEMDEDDDDDGGEAEEEEEVDDVDMPPEAMLIAKRPSAVAAASSSATTTTAVTTNDKKVKIISDISLPNTNPLASSTLESRSNAATAAAAALNAITSGIGIHDTSTEEFITSTDESTTVLTAAAAAAATKAGGGGGDCATNEPKFVSADGNEMILTEEQRKEIMSQLNQDHEGGVVMVLNESAFTEAAADDTNDEASQGDIGEQADGGGDPHTEDELIENAAEEEEYDDSHIYNEFAVPENSESESRKETEDDERESITRLETTHAPQKKEKAKHGGDGGTTAHSKKEEDISKKLKELTGDWSDDENDDDDDVGDGGMLAKSDDETRKIKVEEDLIVEDAAAAATTAAAGVVGAATSAAAAATEVKRSSTSSAAAAAAATAAEENREIKIEEDEEEDEEENGDDQTEDDIDIALKSLHKGIEPADTENRDISSSERGCSFKKTSSAAGGEDIDIKDISTDECSAAKKTKIVKSANNDDDDDEEEEGDDEDGGDGGGGGGGGGGDDSRDAKETLLEELGGGVGVDVDEKVNIKDDIGMMKKAVDNMDVEIVVESNVVKVEENNGDDTTLNIDPLAVSKEDMEGGAEEKTTAIAAAAVAASDSSSATKTKTADKVKSLISEWGDDDDDEDEDDEEGEEDEEDA